jgi:hypothetical protein
VCVRAVSISLYKKHAASIGSKRAAFPITLLGATELSLSATRRSVKPGESSEGQYLLINPMQNSRMLACLLYLVR